MLGVGLVALVTALVASLVYLRRENVGRAGVGMAALRTAAMSTLALLLINPVISQDPQDGPPTVLLDASLSMGANGGKWEDALSAAREAVGDGVIIRFGSAPTPFDSNPPADGASRIQDALNIAHGRAGPIVVMTDGEVEDAGAIAGVLLEGVGVSVFPRDTQPNVALLDVEVAERVHESDSLSLSLVIGTWGALPSGSAELEIKVGDRVVQRRTVQLPQSPGVARRTVTLAPGRLTSGLNVLSVALHAEGDLEPRDDERLRIVTVTASPGIVVIVDPPDVEGRFLVETFRDFAQTPVSGYARIRPGIWIDMNRGVSVSESFVRREVLGADVLVIRGSEASVAYRRGPSWVWPAGVSPTSEFVHGDWYPVASVPPSPLAGRLTRIAWDSLPPATGLVPLVPGEDEWTVLTARLSRRGAERPLVVGYDSSGSRRLLTAATGMWRWSLRGGASLEAFRTILSAGVDWLLESEETETSMLTVSPVTERGRAIEFQWKEGVPPDSVEVDLVGDSASEHWLKFDDTGKAHIFADPGTYRWLAPALPQARGVVIVEEYSDEYHLNRILLTEKASVGGIDLVLIRARYVGWFFVLAVLALIGEWAWRQRRGLP